VPVKVKSLFISWRTIALALLLSVAAGLSSIAEPIDRIIESAVGRVAWRPVSGDIVIVALDDKTLERMGKNDFSMAQHARVVDGVNRAGAKRLFVDFLFDRRGADRDFPKMSAAIRRMGSRAVLAVEAKSADLGDSQLTRFPSPAFGTAAQLACIGWEYEFWQVWRLPTALNVNGRDIPTFSSLLANVRNPKVGTYALDLSYNTDTIRTYSAIDVISGQVGARELAGKDVIFAATATAYQDTHYLPGHDKIPGAFIHLIGGETLKRGQPIDIGWIPALALTAAALIGALAFRRTRHFNWIAVATGLGLIVVKVALMPMLVTVSIGASLFLIATISTNVARTSRRKSAQHENPVSGLPNFEALRTQASYGSATVIAAKVVNFEDLAAFIPGEGLSKLVEQVTRRLQLASQGTTLYHDLDGTFAWLVPYYQHSQIETQLMGLAALFNAPLTIDELKVDVSMAFGVNDEFEGSNAQRSPPKNRSAAASCGPNIRRSKRTMPAGSSASTRSSRMHSTRGTSGSPSSRNTGSRRGSSSASRPSCAGRIRRAGRSRPTNSSFRPKRARTFIA
jgi:CHASE2 domain-containing sensor protein